MDQSLLDKVIERVAAENKGSSTAANLRDIGVTEFVGTAMDNTIGLVIASVDPMLGEVMNLGRYRSIGMLAGRGAAGPHIMSIDDAVKATNTEVISVELTKADQNAGQGCLIVVGADDVSDARRCIEIALATVEKYYGDVYTNEAGHLEFQYTARASYCIEKATGSPVGKAYGYTCGAPAAIGIVLADTAVKAANIDIVSYASPANGTNGEGYSYQNEFNMNFTGDSGAVRQAIRASIEVGKKLLGAMGSEPKSASTPYI